MPLDVTLAAGMRVILLILVVAVVRVACRRLDPGVAQAMVPSRDGLHAAGIVLLGLSMFPVAWLLTRSDLWGHRVLAVTAAPATIPAVSGPEQPPQG